MTIRFRDIPVVFVDVEASGAYPGSFPVEIGWTSDPLSQPVAHLVKPAPGWDNSEAYAEAYHGIPYAALVHSGMPAGELCSVIDEAWSGAILTTDAPGHDGEWLAKLYAAAGRSMPWKFVEVEAVWSGLASLQGIEIERVMAVIEAMERAFPRIHRAGADAHHLARICHATLDPDWFACEIGTGQSLK